MAKTRLCEIAKQTTKRGCVAASDDARGRLTRDERAFGRLRARHGGAKRVAERVRLVDGSREGRAAGRTRAGACGSRRGRLIWRRRGRRWRRPRGLGAALRAMRASAPRRARRQPRRGVFRARRRRCWPGEGGGRAHPPRAPRARGGGVAFAARGGERGGVVGGGFEGGGGGGGARGVVGGEERGGEGVELLAREGRAEEPADPRGVERKVRGGATRAVARAALPRAGANARGMESEREARRSRGREDARERARQRARRRHGRETIRASRGRGANNAKRRGRREGRIPRRGDREDGRREHKGGDANVDALKSGRRRAFRGTPRCRRRRNDRDEISRRATRDRRGSRDRYFNGYLAKRTSPPTIALSGGGPRVGAYIFVTLGANVSGAATSSQLASSSLSRLSWPGA